MRPADVVFVAFGLILLAIGALGATGSIGTASIGGLQLSSGSTQTVVAFSYTVHGYNVTISDRSVYGTDFSGQAVTVGPTNVSWGDGTVYLTKGSLATAGNVSHIYVKGGVTTITDKTTLTVPTTPGSVVSTFFETVKSLPISVPGNTTGLATSSGTTAFLTASFTYATNGLVLNVNDTSMKGTGLTNYSTVWNYGDGSPSSLATTHVYGRAGTFLVTLTASGIVASGSTCGLGCGSAISMSVASNVTVAPNAATAAGTSVSVTPPTINHLNGLNVGLILAGIAAVICPAVPARGRIVTGVIATVVGFGFGFLIGFYVLSSGVA